MLVMDFVLKGSPSPFPVIGAQRSGLNKELAAGWSATRSLLVNALGGSVEPSLAPKQACVRGHPPLEQPQCGKKAEHKKCDSHQYRNNEEDEGHAARDPGDELQTVRRRVGGLGRRWALPWMSLWRHQRIKSRRLVHCSIRHGRVVGVLRVLLESRASMGW